MLRNGFFHSEPLAQDIAVSPELEQVLRCQHINARPVNVRYDNERRVIADIEHEGNKYLARSYRGVDSFLYWLLVEKQEQVTSEQESEQVK